MVLCPNSAFALIWQQDNQLAKNSVEKSAENSVEKSCKDYSLYLSAVTTTRADQLFEWALLLWLWNLLSPLISCMQCSKRITGDCRELATDKPKTPKPQYPQLNEKVVVWGTLESYLCKLWLCCSLISVASLLQFPVYMSIVALHCVTSLLQSHGINMHRDGLCTLGCACTIKYTHPKIGMPSMLCLVVAHNAYGSSYR